MKLEAVIFSLLLICPALVYAQYADKKPEIINNSSMSVDTVYFGYRSTEETRKYAEGVFQLRRKNFVLYKHNRNIIVPIGYINKGRKSDLVVSYNKTYWQPFRKIITKDSIITPVFLSNMLYITRLDGSDEVVEIKDTSEFQFKVGKVQIIQHEDKCRDTGTNSIIFTNKKGTIKFSYLDNIRFFEEDLNQDGWLELYIFTFACCEGKLNIFKVE